ncbi:hypothetical protein K8T06_10270 [bacterium]|nr:hypothetical protein [bacterium]
MRNTVEMLFRNCLKTINPQTLSKSIDFLTKTQAKDSVHNIFNSYPMYIAERVNPKWVKLKLREFEITQKNTVIKTDSKNLLRNALHGLPLLETQYRFKTISWKDLPLLCWEKMEQLDKFLLELDRPTSLGFCYHSVWRSLELKDRERMASWVYYKLCPGSAEKFMKDLNSSDILENQTACNELLHSIALDGEK